MKRLSLIALLLSAVLCSTAFAAEKFSTRTYPLGDFTRLDVSNVVKVIYTQGDSYKVQLTGRADWLNLMEVTSKGGTLKVQAKNSKKFKNVKKKDQPDGEHNFILRLTAPCLQDISLSGVSAFESKRLTPDHLSVRLGGVSKFEADAVECAQCNITLSGTSKAEADQLTCQKFTADVSGASKVDIERLQAKDVQCDISGASKAELPQLSKGEKATFTVSGASKLTLSAEVSGQMQVGISGASKGELTYKGGSLLTRCTGASKLKADVNCTAINASCDGASKTYFSGKADKVEIDRSGVAVNIDTSRLNKF